MRGRVLSAINCGTGYGVALAAPIAIVAGASWRSAWLAFAAVALAATGVGGPRRCPLATRSAPAGPPPYGWSGVVCRRSLPLLAGGVLLGLGSAAYWTFAVEHLTDAGGLSPAASRTFLAIVGVAGVLATLTGDLMRRLGARQRVRRRHHRRGGRDRAAGAAAPSAPPRVASAILFGAAYNAAVAVQAIWSLHVFAERPSLGLAAAMGANGVGLMLGPLGAGLLAGPLGTGAVLAIGAAVVAVSGVLAPREAILPEAGLRPEPAVATVGGSTAGGPPAPRRGRRGR